MDTSAEQRLEGWMDAYGTQIKHFCSLQLRDKTLADDAAQDVFIKAWRHLDTFRGECSEKTWLMRIAVNTCRDYQRTGWSRWVDRGVPLEALPEERAEPGFADDTVARAVSQLPGPQREAVLLHYYQHLTLRETAQALRVSDAAVKRRLKKAKQSLHRTLKGWYDNEE